MTTVDLRIEHLSRRFGDVEALRDASLEVERGELVSILGPSGCGKSTLLQLIAGHIAPDGGRIEISGRCVADGSGTMVPAQSRGVGMVFQDYALFPHLDVAANVAYGLPGRGLGRMGRRRERAARVRELLELLRIGDIAGRNPGELSGGQQQRVAIARALAQGPCLLLLDEPFCNLDAATREHVRGEIVSLLRASGVTCLFVTHDQEEALAISDRVAVMQGGRVMQVADPETLYRRPFCMEVAEFLGRTNVLDGTARGGIVDTEVGSFPLLTPATGPVQVLVRPELIDVRPDPAGTATVRAREFRGHDVVYAIELAGGAIVWAHRPSVDMAAIGSRVRLEPQPGAATLFHPPVEESAIGTASNADVTAAPRRRRRRPTERRPGGTPAPR